MDRVISEFDIKALELIRSNVESFMRYVSDKFASDLKGGECLLDIAPQVHSGAKPFFNKKISIDTLDIDPNSGATYIIDLCDIDQQELNGKYDFVVCTEVLEHTRQPFNAAKNIYNFLKPGGHAFISTPYNFRIHGPLPDCWRFTEHGLKELFVDFEIIDIRELICEDRFLMPYQYTTIVKRPN